MIRIPVGMDRHDSWFRSSKLETPAMQGLCRVMGKRLQMRYSRFNQAQAVRLMWLAIRPVFVGYGSRKMAVN